MSVRRAKSVFYVAIAGLLGFLLGAVLAGREQNAPSRSAFSLEARGHLARLDAVAAPGQILFLGSSTFHALDVGSVANRSLNLGLGGDTIGGLLERMRGYRSLAWARGVVLNIGLNDLIRSRSIEAVQGDLAELFRAIPGDTPLVVLGIQRPSGEALERRPELGKLSAELDSRFVQACRRRSACVFVENPADGTSNGSSMLGVDGIHLSPDGYEELRRRLRAALPAVGLEAAP